jgi:ketosteroid isomerase-like protein
VWKSLPITYLRTIGKNTLYIGKRCADLGAVDREDAARVIRLDDVAVILAAPQLKVKAPPPVSAAFKAASVQLAGGPIPTMPAACAGGAIKREPGGIPAVG